MISLYEELQKLQRPGEGSLARVGALEQEKGVFKCPHLLKCSLVVCIPYFTYFWAGSGPRL